LSVSLRARQPLHAHHCTDRCTLEEISDVKCAVKRWLAAVAVVRDPTWVQMEAESMGSQSRSASSDKVVESCFLSLGLQLLAEL